MRYAELITPLLEGPMSMSDLAYLINEISKMDRSDNVKVRFEQGFIFKLEFKLENTCGSIWFRPKRQGSDIGTIYTNKLISAARAMMGGNRPRNTNVAYEVLKNKSLSNRAIKTLTNRNDMEVVGLRWAGMTIGRGNH